jgi:hypothetical protein
MGRTEANTGPLFPARRLIRAVTRFEISNQGVDQGGDPGSESRKRGLIRAAIRSRISKKGFDRGADPVPNLDKGG